MCLLMLICVLGLLNFATSSSAFISDEDSYRGALHLVQADKSIRPLAYSKVTLLVLSGFMLPQLLILCHLVPVADRKTVVLPAACAGAGVAMGLGVGVAGGVVDGVSVGVGVGV